MVLHSVRSIDLRIVFSVFFYIYHITQPFSPFPTPLFFSILFHFILVFFKFYFFALAGSFFFSLPSVPAIDHGHWFPSLSDRLFFSPPAFQWCSSRKTIGGPTTKSSSNTDHLDRYDVTRKPFCWIRHFSTLFSFPLPSLILLPLSRFEWRHTRLCSLPCS